MKILIATDFSESSKQMLKFVLHMMKDTQTPCKILLLNTYRVQQTDPRKIIPLNDELKIKSRSALQQERESAMGTVSNPQISIEAISQLGSLHNVVLKLYTTEEINMIAWNRSELETLCPLITQFKCPVLLI